MIESTISHNIALMIKSSIYHNNINAYTFKYFTQLIILSIDHAFNHHSPIYLQLYLIRFSYSPLYLVPPSPTDIFEARGCRWIISTEEKTPPPTRTTNHRRGLAPGDQPGDPLSLGGEIRGSACNYRIVISTSPHGQHSLVFTLMLRRFLVMKWEINMEKCNQSNKNHLQCFQHQSQLLLKSRKPARFSEPPTRSFSSQLRREI